MKHVLYMVVLLIVAGCHSNTQTDEEIVPKNLPNGVISISKSGKNWPETYAQINAVAGIDLYYTNGLGFGIQKSLDSISREVLSFSFFLPQEGKVILPSYKTVIENWAKNINLPYATFSIHHEDEPHAYYVLADDYISTVDIIRFDETTRTLEATFDLKLVFDGDDQRWNFTIKEFNDVKDRVLFIKGKISLTGVNYRPK